MAGKVIKMNKSANMKNSAKKPATTHTYNR